MPANDVVEGEKGEPLVEIEKSEPLVAAFPILPAGSPYLLLHGRFPIRIYFEGVVSLRHGGQTRLDFHNSSPERSDQHFLRQAICCLRKRSKKDRQIYFHLEESFQTSLSFRLITSFS